jgi:hypothetical protein
VLDRLRNIAITEWQYKGQTERHIGPMAQDFYAAFGLGAGDTGIASIDADGVALASIKALMIELEILKSRVNELENGGLKNQKKNVLSERKASK